MIRTVSIGRSKSLPEIGERLPAKFSLAWLGANPFNFLLALSLMAAPPVMALDKGRIGSETLLAATAPPVMSRPDQGMEPNLSDAGVVTSPSPSKNFSLGASFDKAEEQNKELASASWTLPIAKAAIRTAAAVPNPQFNAQLGFGPAFTLLYTGQTQQVGLFQELQTAGKRSKKIALAKANLALAELQFDALRFDLHNRVRRAYAELAAAEAYVSLIESQKNVALQLVQVAQKRFNSGKAAKAEILQAQLNALQFDTQRNQAQLRLQQASAALELILGGRPERIEIIDVDDNGIFKLSAEKTSIVPSPARELPRVEELISTADKSRLDLLAAQQQIFVSRRAVALAKAMRVPDIFLGGGYQFSTFSQNQPPQLAAVSNGFGNAAFISLTVENPLFYQHQGELQQALANLRQSERRANLLQQTVATDTVNAYTAVSVARANIFIFQQNLLPTAVEVARIARRRYEVGRAGLVTAIVAQQQYQQVLASYFDAVVAYQTAWADLEKSVGVPLRL